MLCRVSYAEGGMPSIFCGPQAFAMCFWTLPSAGPLGKLPVSRSVWNLIVVELSIKIGLRASPAVPQFPIQLLYWESK
jgi:hypothetical protein